MLLNQHAHSLAGRLITLVALMAASACSDSNVAAPTRHPIARPTILSRNPVERRLEILTDSLPELGGYYLDAAGDLHAMLTDLSVAPRAATVLRSLLAEITPAVQREHGRAPRLVFEQGRYTAAELRRWRNALIGLAFSRQGVQGIGILADANVVHVDVTDLDAANSVQALAASIGVPSQALTVTVVAPERDFDSLTNLASLFAGALKITNPSIGPCTLGFNTYDGVSFVTASHCTNRVGFDNATAFYQPDGSGAYVGHESNDAEPWTQDQTGEALCPPDYNCRWSDAAVIAYPSAVAPGTAGMGKIYKTNDRRSWGGGSLAISGTLTITGEGSQLIQGQTLDKIGAVSGWTYGTLSDPCYTTLSTGTMIVFVCQGRVGGYGTNGDSGSPVFELNGDSAVMYGILRGGGGGVYYSFSPIWNIAEELGYVPSY